MPDFIGNIPVPEITPSGVFPLLPDYPLEVRRDHEVAVHQFGSGNAKVEQRFLLGTGARRFTIRKQWLRDADRIALRNFWESKYGPYGSFTYNAPNDNGVGTTPVICRFANEPLSWEMVADWACSLGVTLVEVPQASPSYPLNQAVNRFPPAALQAALLAQVQEIIPLVRIQPLETGYPSIYVSDRRCTIGGQLYQARLLEFDGISQSIGNESDEARFTFGNADRVMRDLANDVDLFRAEIAFSLFHVGTGIRLDLWKGNIVNWTCDAGPEFRVTAADGLYELNLPYPARKISRTCWKRFNDGQACPFSSQGSLDLVNYPNASATSCDKGFDTPNGCRAHSMNNYFGGIVAKPQGVRVKDNSTGVWGLGRKTLTSVSIVADWIYDQPLPEIYTDSAMPVTAKIASGRDEGDFYAAVGIVGEGPLGAYGSGHKLDGQYHHGYPGSLGLMTSTGPDPNPTTFGFDTDNGPERAAGTAFLMIRRSDEKGLQLSRLTDHAMEAIVAQGLGGWTWTAPGVRSWQGGITNPIWIAVNMLLRARGLRLGPSATQQQLDYAETLFDVQSAVAAAGICNDQVPKLVGAGTETQFKFRGVLQDEKPLRDWLQEVLMNCLGYYTFANGKLKLGVRVNSSAVEAFTEGNILFRSLQLAPLKPSFNHLTANFADEDYDFVANSISLYDIDHASLISGGSGPLFLKSTINLSGTASKSQAARIITVRLREELGGITPEEWKKARQIAFRTTVLALNTEPGMVCSMTHPDMPGGTGEFRVTGWRLNRDYSIDIEGRTTTDSMYDLVSGPKPADVIPAPLPVEEYEPEYDVPDPSAAELVSVDGTGAVARITLRYRVPDSRIFVGVVVFARWLNAQSQPIGSLWQAGGGDALPYEYNGEDWSDVAVEISQPADDAAAVRLFVCGRSLKITNTPGSSTASVDVTVPMMIILAAGPPVAPNSAALYRSNYDSQNFIIATEWTMPSSIGGSRNVEVHLRYFSDSGGSTPVSDWIKLGSADVNDVRLHSGPFGKPVSAAWARARVRTLNLVGDASAWVTSNLVDIPAADNPIWELPAPQSPVSAVSATAQYLDDGSYGILTQWTAPSPLGSTVAYEVQVRFWADSGLTQPITDWYTLGETYPPETQLLSGWWPRAAYDSWFKVRVRPLNAKNVGGAWAEAAAAVMLAKLPAPAQPAYCSVTVLPASDTHYSLRVHYSPVQPYATAYHLYLQFYADEALTQPDGDPRLVLTTTNTSIVPPYLYPYELLGPFPRNIDARWVKAGVAAVNIAGAASAIRWSPLADRIDPVLAPPPPAAVSLALNQAVDGGIETFGFTVTVTKPSATGTTDGYEAEARFWLDSGLTQPDSDWIPLGWIDPETPTLVTDRWPKASYTAYARVRVRAINLWGIGDAWIESNTVTIVAGALNLNEARASTIGEGLAVAAGKLKTKVDGVKLAHDVGGNITTAPGRDLPAVVSTPPGTTYLGADTVIYAGHLYTWRGSSYQPDTDAAWVKQQLQANGLTADEFAYGFAPVRLVTVVPNFYVGDFIVNTADRKLYRWNGTAYARPMAGGDIKSELQLDRLTAAEIAAGAIQTTHLAGNVIQVRPTAGYVPRFEVFDGAGNLIGAIGQYSGYDGLFAINARFGGSLSNPKISLSATQALLKDVVIDVTSGNGRIIVDPGSGISITSQATGSSNSIYMLALTGASSFMMTSGGVLSVALSASSGYGRIDLYGENSYLLTAKIFCDTYTTRGGTTLIDSSRRAYFAELSVGGGVAIDGLRAGNLTALAINSQNVIDSSRNANFASLQIGGTAAIDSSRNASFLTLSVGGSVAVDNFRNATLGNVTASGYLKSSEYRFSYLGSENIALGGITISRWIPAYDANGNWIGKIPIIPT